MLLLTACMLQLRSSYLPSAGDEDGLCSLCTVEAATRARAFRFYPPQKGALLHLQSSEAPWLFGLPALPTCKPGTPKARLYVCCGINLCAAVYNGAAQRVFLYFKPLQ